MERSVTDEFIWNDVEKTFVHKPTVEFVFQTLETVAKARGEQIDIDVMRLLLADESPAEYFVGLLAGAREASMEAFEEDRGGS